MRRLCELPFCGPVLGRQVVALEIQLREIRRAFRHGSVAPRRIRVALVCPQSTAPPRQHVLSMTSDLRDNQKAYRGSSLREREGSRGSSCCATPEYLST